MPIWECDPVYAPLLIRKIKPLITQWKLTRDPSKMCQKTASFAPKKPT